MSKPMQSANGIWLVQKRNGDVMVKFVKPIRLAEGLPHDEQFHGLP